MTDKQQNPDASNEFTGADMLQQMFEPMPIWGEHWYAPGMKVVNKRLTIAGIPVGTRGVVNGVERPKNEYEASADYFKGRIVEVEFDCSHLPVPDDVAAAIRRSKLPFEVPPFWGKVTTNVQPQDIRPIVPGVTPENVAKVVEDICKLKDGGPVVRALKAAHKINRVIAAQSNMNVEGGVDVPVALTLFRAGILDYMGVTAGGAAFRLTEFGWHVARQLDERLQAPQGVGRHE